MSITLIKNGTVVSDGVIRRADVLIRDGVIADADFTGDVSSVEPCEVIDAEGCYVSPAGSTSTLTAAVGTILWTARSRPFVPSRTPT